MRLRAVKRTDWWVVGSGAVGGGEGDGDCVAGGGGGIIEVRWSSLMFRSGQVGKEYLLLSV